jgi:3-deoxy-D-manno-octulosonic-acid transferase
MRADLTERALRGLYSAALYVLVPITVYHLIWRGFRQPAYLQRWGERYGFYATPSTDPVLWVHAVSVGEVNAAAPLVDALLARHPRERLLVTTITPTGSARVRALWGERVDHVYLPYDLPGAVSRFLRHFRPRIGLILETELWPNLLFGCRDHGVPAIIVNGRLSERSLQGYGLLKPLVGRALRSLRGIVAQSKADAERFLRLGASPKTTVVGGNLKFDIAADPQAQAFAREFRAAEGSRLAWIAASTHAGEEAAVLALHRRLRQRWPDLLLLWAPRHPERFRPAAYQAAQAGFRTATRQMTHQPDAGDDVFVVDTLGELARFYTCADVAFVGGSLEDIGGHNLLEPAAAGTAMVTGPHLRNFADIAAQLEAAGALCIGADEAAVGDALEMLLADPDARVAMANAAQPLLAQGRGALERTLRFVDAMAPAATTG